MKLQINLLLFILLNTISQCLSAQSEYKLFYDDEWKGCAENRAAFYRLVTLDDDGNPIGEIKDYYITGELQGKIDGAIKINKEDDKNSKIKGRAITYYKNGNKKHEGTMRL